jgi:mannose/fructose/N-acetylgalactosamine-specific phosphotransferase system component IIB
LSIEHLNIGGLRQSDSRVAFAPSIYLSVTDIRALIMVLERGVTIDVQTVPRERPININLELLEQCLTRRRS